MTTNLTKSKSCVALRSFFSLSLTLHNVYLSLWDHLAPLAHSGHFSHLDILSCRQLPDCSRMPTHENHGVLHQGKGRRQKMANAAIFLTEKPFFFSCSLRLTVFITYSDVLWVQRDLDSNWKSLFPYSPVAREKCWHCTFLQTTDPASADPCWDVGRTVVAWQLGEMAAEWDTTVSRRSFNIQVSEKPLDPFEEMWGHFPDGFFWHVGTIFRFF